MLILLTACGGGSGENTTNHPVEVETVMPAPTLEVVIGPPVGISPPSECQNKDKHSSENQTHRNQCKKNS